MHIQVNKKLTSARSCTHVQSGGEEEIEREGSSTQKLFHYRLITCGYHPLCVHKPGQSGNMCFDHKSQDRKRRSCAKAYLIISPWSTQLASNDKADERCDDCSDVIWWGVNSRQLTWRFQEVFPCQRDLKTVSSRQKPCQVGAPNCWWSWQLARRWADRILQWFCLLISLLISQ